LHAVKEPQSPISSRPGATIVADKFGCWQGFAPLFAIPPADELVLSYPERSLLIHMPKITAAVRPRRFRQFLESGFIELKNLAIETGGKELSCSFSEGANEIARPTLGNSKHAGTLPIFEKNNALMRAYPKAVLMVQVEIDYS
jgi:hypothetical protein